MMSIKTTTDCVKRAKSILAQAGKVQTKKDHGAVWDKKVDLLNKVNDSLASGAFKGEALDELRTAKHILHQAEKKAGEQSRKTYMKK